MKNIKVISGFLYYITRFTAILYFLVILYALVSLTTQWSYITFDNGNYFSICYPFSETPFLNGENSWSYKIFNFIIPLSFYSVFFFLISNVFKGFKQPKLFTDYNVRQLHYFSFANIFIPLLIILLAKMFTETIEEGSGYVTVIHFFIGIFSYFLSEIFKQGLHLQNEQDLYI
jgi:hypothetical protein